MNRFKLLILLACSGAIGCDGLAAVTSSSESMEQYLPRLRPRTVWAARDLNLPAYVLDARRGTLAPSMQRFSVKQSEPFTAFDIGHYTTQEPRRDWIQTELAPPEFIVVTADDVEVGEFQHTLEPLYVSHTRGACPLFIPRPSRLEPLFTPVPGTPLFLFHEPTVIDTDETADEFEKWKGQAPYFGYYTDAYVNVRHVADNRRQTAAFISALCLSHPTPQPAGSSLLAHQLGNASGFTEALFSQLELAEPNNLGSSNLERMRLANETCEDILLDIQPIADALRHDAVGEELPTAAVFLCAEADNSSGALTYRMAPTTIGVETSLGSSHTVALLVINLSPPNRVSNTEQALEFGAYSYNDIRRASEIVAISAFDGTFKELATGVYRVDAGIRNALWVVIESHDPGNIEQFQFSSGVFNHEVLSQYYSEQPWWNISTSVTGKIVHE